MIFQLENAVQKYEKKTTIKNTKKMNDETTRKHTGHECYKYNEADRRMRRADIAMAWIFGALGVAALAAAVIYGAWHQLIAVAFSSAMVAALAKEARELKPDKD